MKVLVVIGPSASGKSTVVRELARRGRIAVTPSWTTRPRRADEHGDTLEHRFVSEEEFDRLERQRFFLDVVRMFGLPYRYGLPPVDAPREGLRGPNAVVARVPTVMVRAPLMDLVDRHFPEHVVYQVEDGYDRVRARLQERGVGASELGDRLDGYHREVAAGRVVATRTFQNRGSILDLVDAVEAALAEDFAAGREEDPMSVGGAT